MADVFILKKFTRDLLILITTIDPIGSLILFSIITSKFSKREKKKIALKSILYSAIILLSSIAIGQIILNAMGIQLRSLQIAGGIILFLFGIQMIFGIGPTKKSRGESGHDIAVFPLAVPAIAGPGGIMAVILLTDSHLFSIYHQIATSIIMILVLGITYLLMLQSDTVLRIIGRNGSSILISVMGMILAALSIEFLMAGFGLPNWSGP